MFNRKPNAETQALEEAITAAIKQLDVTPAYSKEYAKTLKCIERLNALKNDSSARVSPDVLATVLANLAGIALIVGHERAHVVTSKALSFVMKLAR